MSTAISSDQRLLKRNKRLKKLITVIGDMELGNYQDNSIDAFGDTYEYLMGMYASNAGKSGGEFLRLKRYLSS